MTALPAHGADVAALRDPAVLPPPRRQRVLLGLTGSVATVKWAALAAALSEFADVRVLPTRAARHFMAMSEAYDAAAWARLAAVTPPPPVLDDDDEWRDYASVHGDAVLHIELRRWADVLVVAPLSANTLAKLAAGLADNLLTCVARAWDFRAGKPVVIAPAMNTAMWEHPLTAAHLRLLGDVLGITIVPPTTRALACGDVGAGAMAAVGDVVDAVRAATRAGMGGGGGGGSG